MDKPIITEPPEDILKQLESQHILTYTPKTNKWNTLKMETNMEVNNGQKVSDNNVSFHKNTTENSEGVMNTSEWDIEE